MKHTKGPWLKSNIMNFSDTLVAYIENSEGKPVAQLRGCETGEEVEAEANALLISKCPEMLEALKWLVNAMNDGSLQVFTDDDDHKAVRDDNQDHINEIEALVKELE